ncbi:hypothetical protein [Plantactinospora sp. WMMB782]|uniref:hypothetical protein n=1 Tax=Plantactinospora sp. WMMB782 TaxID=3404121 RepID=UPI003B959EA0
MANLLDRIDRATSGLCPCGAAPAAGSAYCSDDCRPSHLGGDTDTREAGHLATPMRWRPDLVTATDDHDLVVSSGPTWYEGPYRAQIFQRAGRPGSWHLRLDDGHRYVGRDLETVGHGDHEPSTVDRSGNEPGAGGHGNEPGAGGHGDEPGADGHGNEPGAVPEQLFGRVRQLWRRLERELTDPRRTMPYPGPWQPPAPTGGGPSPTAGIAGPARLASIPDQEWRRLCQRCERHGVPLEGRRDGEPCQLCAHCRTPYPGPVLVPTLQLHGRHTVLKLSYFANGEYFTRSAFVPGRDMMAAEDPAQLLQSAWDRLENFLLDQMPRSAPRSDDPTAG